MNRTKNEKRSSLGEISSLKKSIKLSGTAINNNQFLTTLKASAIRTKFYTSKNSPEHTESNNLIFNQKVIQNLPALAENSMNNLTAMKHKSPLINKMLNVNNVSLKSTIFDQIHKKIQSNSHSKTNSNSNVGGTSQSSILGSGFNNGSNIPKINLTNKNFYIKTIKEMKDISHHKKSGEEGIPSTSFRKLDNTEIKPHNYTSKGSTINSPRDTLISSNLHRKIKISSINSGSNTIINNSKEHLADTHGYNELMPHNIKNSTLTASIKNSRGNSTRKGERMSIESPNYDRLNNYDVILKDKDGKLSISSIKNKITFNQKNQIQLPQSLQNKSETMNTTTKKLFHSMNNSINNEGVPYGGGSGNVLSGLGVSGQVVNKDSGNSAMNNINVIQFRPQTKININNINVIVNGNGNGKLEISEVIKPILNNIYKTNTNGNSPIRQPQQNNQTSSFRVGTGNSNRLSNIDLENHTIHKPEKIDVQFQGTQIKNFNKPNKNSVINISSIPKEEKTREKSEKEIEQHELKIKKIKGLSQPKNQREIIDSKEKSMSVTSTSLMENDDINELKQPNIPNEFMQDYDNLVKHIKSCKYLTLKLKDYRENNEYPPTNINFYKIGRLIGKGAFGNVNIGLHVGTGKIIAIKSFNKKKFSGTKEYIKIKNELNIWSNLKSPYVTKFYEKIETDKHILLLMEYVAGGDLLNFVRRRTKLNELVAKFIFKQIVESVYFIHSKGFCHRDIKLDNILISLDNRIKLCDFGVSTQYREDEKLKHLCGTPAYIAPEVLKNTGYDGQISDIWSLGVALYVMLNGTVPFKAVNLKDLHKSIMKGQYPPIKELSNEGISLLNGLLEVNPKHRFTIKNILVHPWLQDVINYEHDAINLFTESEKIQMINTSMDYRQAKKKDIKEKFNPKLLDSINDLDNQNIKTKSIILAPFCSSVEKHRTKYKRNSSGSNALSHDSITFFDQELEIDNNLIKFDKNVIGLNKNYERNNNGELDNGVFIKKKEDKSSAITEKCSQKNSKKNSGCVTPAEYFLPRDSNSVGKGNQILRIEDVTLKINDNIVKQVMQLGYKKEDIIKSLKESEGNYMTATYYILSG